MNWRFWTKKQQSDRARNGSCAAIMPLLSSYADHMTSPEETQRIDAHLADCPECQQELRWIAATSKVIAQRPVVIPPADLQARILRAVAAANTQIPLVPVRPVRRPLVLRPAFGALAASILVGAAALSLHLLDGHFGHSGPAAHPIATQPHPQVIVSQGKPSLPSLPIVKPTKPKTGQVAANSENSEKHGVHIFKLPQAAPNTVASNTMPDAASDSSLHPIEIIRHPVKLFSAKAHSELVAVKVPRFKMPKSIFDVTPNNHIANNHSAENNGPQIATNSAQESPSRINPDAEMPAPSAAGTMTPPPPVTVPKNIPTPDQVASNTQSLGSLKNVYDIYSAKTGSMHTPITAVTFANYHGSGRRPTTDTSTEHKLVADGVYGNFQ